MDMKFINKNSTQCHNCCFSLSGSEKFCPECGSNLLMPSATPIPPDSLPPNDADRLREKNQKNELNTILDPDDSTLEWYIGPDRDTSWNDAIDWLNKLQTNTGDDWRMPTRAHLKALYDDSVSSHCKIKPTESSWLWVWTGEKATDQDLNNSKMAWGFDFRRGLEFWGGCDESLRSRVFAVRSVQADQRPL